MGISIPTKARFMTEDEYTLVTRVFGNTLPVRKELIVTNAAGIGGRAFTIPVSLINSLIGGIAAGAFISLLSGYFKSSINNAFIISVGENYDNLNTTERGLLVHETAHAWQGKNSFLTSSYVFNSCLNQCLFGEEAYKFQLGKLWNSYNAEEQAAIITKWFLDYEPKSGIEWEYISKYVRKGITWS